MPKANFRPDTEGFGFFNNWMLDGTEITDMTNIVTAAVTVAVEPIVVAVISPLLAAELATPLGPLLVAGTILETVDFAKKSILTAIEMGHYGFCGGMAFTALDYWNQSLFIPTGTGPTDQPHQDLPAGKILRDFIVNRQFQSLSDNAVTFVQWVTILNLPLGPKGSWLRDQSKAQLVVVKAKIDSGMPVTLGLVADSWNPFKCHEVLVYGYQDQSDGSTTLFMYDSNFPLLEKTIRVDFSKHDLNVIQEPGSAENHDWDQLKGFFISAYNPLIPPVSIVQSQSLVSNLATAEVNTNFNIAYTVKNIGFSKSPSFLMGVADDRGGTQLVATVPGQLLFLVRDTSWNFSATENFVLPGTVTFTIFGVPIRGDHSTPLHKKIPALPDIVSEIKVKIIAIRAIRVHNPGQNCVVDNAAGSTTTFEAPVDDLGDHIQFQWSVTGGTIVDSATSPLVSIKMPELEGAQVDINVIVTGPQGIASSGKLSFQTVGKLSTGLQLAVCKMRRVISTTPLSGLYHGPVPPGPEKNNVSQETVMAPIEKKELETVKNSLQELTHAIEAALTSTSPVFYPVALEKKQ